jgi:hypothetical protein
MRLGPNTEEARSSPVGAFTERINGGTMTYAVPRDDRLILTPDQVLRAPERGLSRVVVRRPDETFARSSALHRFLCVNEVPLEEWVLAEWKRGYRPTLAIETLEGVAVTVLTWHFPPTPSNVDVVSKVYVAPAQGCVVARNVDYYEGRMVRDVSAHIAGTAESGFYFESAAEKSYGNDGTLREEFSAKMITLSRQDHADASLFEVESLENPAGTSEAATKGGTREGI